MPTLAEAGVPNQEADTILGVLAPAHTPPAIVNSLNREIVHIIQLPDVKKRWETLGAEAMPMTPAEFDKYVLEQSQVVAKLVETAHIQIK